MSTKAEIGVGVIGLGFMGRTHLAGFRQAQRGGRACRIVAVCDQVPSRRAGVIGSAGNFGAVADDDEGPALFDPADVNAYAEPEALLADERVDLLSICTHTDTHADLAIRALAAGKHVLIEKPVAVASRDVQRVVEAAARVPEQVCMPAMCMRFWPGWAWLKERIERGTFGPVVSATFERLGSKPDWAAEFYGDAERSGAALIDLHIHDADFVRWCFGDPISVASAGSIYQLTTMYRFDGGPSRVVAEGGWDQAPGFPFRMRYVVNFADATADFDLSREAPLMLTREGKSEPVELEATTGYEVEIAHVLDVIAGKCELVATLDDALAVARLLETERESLATGGVVAVRL